MERLSIRTDRLLPRTIRGRIILLLFVVLIPILLLQAGIYYRRFQERRAAELQANLEVARAVAAAFEEYFQDVLHQELAIGLAFSSPQPLSSEQANQYLAINARDYPTIRELEWISPRGQVLASSRPTAVGLDVSSHPYFQEIVTGREWTVTDLLPDLITGEPTFFIARGVRDQGGTLLGIVVGSVDTPHLDRVLPVKRAGEGAFTIIDRQGMLVYRYPAVNLSWEKRSLIGAQPFIRSVLAGEEVTRSFISEINGEVRLGGFTPIRSIGWVARASRSEAVVQAEVLQDLVRDSVLFLLVTLGAFLVALFVSRNITIPVSHVRQYATSLGGEGNGQQAEITGPRELEELAATFSRMAEQIQVREDALRAQVAARDNANVALRDAQQRLLMEREQERKALARELHDEIIQDLLSINYQLEPIMSDGGNYVDELAEIYDSISTLVDAIRHIGSDLRPPTIDSLGLSAAIQSFTDDWSTHSGVAVQLDLDDNLGRLPEVVELSIFRIVQEELSNIRKHAGASTVRIGLKHTSPDSLLISIVDDGCGIRGNLDLAAFAAEGHYGLLGISERVALLGGRLQVQNQPGGGVMIEAEIPLP